MALVNRREARIFDGRVERLTEREQVIDDVRGRHRQGGPSQANYERSVENEVDQHLRHVGTELYRRWQSACPADGTPLAPVADLREAAVEQAVLQDAEVLVLEDPAPGREPSGGIGALLRF